MALGIGLVPEDRKKEGLFLVKEVRFNLTLKVLRRFINPLRVAKAKEDAIVDRYIQELSIKTPSPEQLIGNLSGGNQQKVIIARWLATEPSVLILDEPTRGVDVGAKAEIYAIMNELAAKGVAIIMISSELPEIINMSDSVVVMGDGRVKGTLPREALSQEKIMFLATEGM
jgi:ABC-type sugar transport system ATPase subunit